MTEQEQKAFDQMRQKIEKALIYLAHSGKFSRSGAKDVLNEAITAANAVSHPKPETTPAPEGGAIASESAANAVQPQAQGEASEYARGFADGMNEAPTGDCWVRAIDEAMVGAHLGVADMGDDYGTAKEKLNTLICWHVAVARDPQAAEPAWRPIESAPKDGTPYLALGDADMWVENEPEGHCAGNWEWSESRRQWRGHAHSDDRFATHWMPLPAAPEAP